NGQKTINNRKSQDKKYISWHNNLVLYVMKTVSFLLLGLTCSAPLMLNAQDMQWRNPMKSGFDVLQGRLPMVSLKDSYQRLPDDMESLVRPPVWHLSRQNAGIYLEFKTNADAITVRYQVSEPVDMPHMPAT